jgi:hypothetical protein
MMVMAGSAQILSNLTANWRQWLSPASQQTMSQGGYFATQVAPGLQSNVFPPPQ